MLLQGTQSVGTPQTSRKATENTRQESLSAPPHAQVTPRCVGSTRCLPQPAARTSLVSSNPLSHVAPGSRVLELGEKLCARRWHAVGAGRERTAHVCAQSKNRNAENHFHRVKSEATFHFK